MDFEIAQSAVLLAITAGAGLLGKLLVVGLSHLNESPEEDHSGHGWFHHVRVPDYPGSYALSLGDKKEPPSDRSI